MSESKEPIRNTVSQIALALARSILQSTDSLMSALIERGDLSTDPDSPNSSLVRLECLVFCWFLLDIAVYYGFGPHADAIREKLPLCLYHTLVESGTPIEILKPLEGHRRTRFTEYSQALPSDIVHGSFLSLARLAWQRIGSGLPTSYTAVSMLEIHRAEIFPVVWQLSREIEVI